MKPSPTPKPADTAARQQLAAAAGEIRATLKAIADGERQAERDSATCENLDREIAALKASGDVCDPTTIRALREKQDALSLRQERAAQREAAPAPLQARLRVQLTELVPIMRALSQQLHADLLAEIAAKLRPYVERDTDSALEFFTANCRASLELGRVVGCSWGDRIRTDATSAARSALVDAGLLLGGSKFWLRL